MDSQTTVEKPLTLPAPEFVAGQHVKLRPVLEGDLPALALLMAEAPFGFDGEGEVWTTQRLRKKFEDEKEPGLWGRRKRYFTVTDMQGEICGVLLEAQERLGLSIALQISASRSDRDTLGPDALATHIEYRRSWHNTPRIEMLVLEPQVAERAWLERAGFEYQFRAAEAWLYLGEVVDLHAYAWIADWVRSNRAADGIGE